MNPDIRHAVKVVVNPGANAEQISRNLAVLHKEPRAMEYLMSEGLSRLGADSAMLEIGIKVAKYVMESSQMAEPLYHNRRHFADVMTGFIRLAQSEPAHHISHDTKTARHALCLGLIAAAGHDLGHPGGINNKPEELERNSTALLMKSGTLNGLSKKDQEFVCDVIHQTDHMGHMQDSRVSYMQALDAAGSGGAIPTDKPVVAALLRQADLFVSVGINLENTKQQAVNMKGELQVARETRCPQLKKMDFVDGVDKPAGMTFFVQSNPCILHSDEATKLRKAGHQILQDLLPKAPEQELESELGMDR